MSGVAAARRPCPEMSETSTSQTVDLPAGSTRTPEASIARADAAMYAGKRLGGARVVLASELPPDA